MLVVPVALRRLAHEDGEAATGRAAAAAGMAVCRDALVPALLVQGDAVTQSLVASRCWMAATPRSC